MTFGELHDAIVRVELHGLKNSMRYLVFGVPPREFLRCADDLKVAHWPFQLGKALYGYVKYCGDLRDVVQIMMNEDNSSKGGDVMWSGNVRWPQSAVTRER